MLNYPSSGDIIAVQGVRKKEDCRAYRVFEYYIETLIADLEGEGLTRDEAEDRVFYARREDESNPGSKPASDFFIFFLCLFLSRRGVGL